MAKLKNKTLLDGIDRDLDRFRLDHPVDIFMDNWYYPMISLKMRRNGNPVPTIGRIFSIEDCIVYKNGRKKYTSIPVEMTLSEMFQALSDAVIERSLNEKKGAWR